MEKIGQRTIDELIAENGYLIVPSVYDVLSAVVAQRLGFAAAFLSGSGVSFTSLGMPDAGFVGLSDIEPIVRRSVRASGISLLVDADNGYGSAINVFHTTEILEQAGAAGVMIEDQAVPLRSPSLGGQSLIPVDEAVGKIRAAVDARSDPSFLIVARSDAANVEGLQSGIDRMNRYAEAGADAAFISGRFDVSDLVAIGNNVSTRHKILSNMFRIGGAADLSVDELVQMGFDVFTTGKAILRSAILGMTSYLRVLQDRGLDEAERVVIDSDRSLIDDWPRLTGFDRIRRIEEAYIPPSTVKERYERHPTY